MFSFYIFVHFMELTLPFGTSNIIFKENPIVIIEKSLFNGFKRNNKIIFNFAWDLVDIIPNV